MEDGSEVSTSEWGVVRAAHAAQRSKRTPHAPAYSAALRARLGGTFQKHTRSPLRSTLDVAQAQRNTAESASHARTDARQSARAFGRRPRLACRSGPLSELSRRYRDHLLPNGSAPGRPLASGIGPAANGR